MWGRTVARTVNIARRCLGREVVVELQRPYTDDELACALRALSHPVRLAIVRALREPRCLSEIGISPSQEGGRAGIRRGEILARQTVKHHLDLLAEVGIVVANEPPRKENGTGTEYILNPHALVVISEAFQELAKFFANHSLVTVAPMEAPPRAAS